MTTTKWAEFLDSHLPNAYRYPLYAYPNRHVEHLNGFILFAAENKENERFVFRISYFNQVVRRLFFAKYPTPLFTRLPAHLPLPSNLDVIFFDSLVKKLRHNSPVEKIVIVVIILTHHEQGGGIKFSHTLSE